jgi:uncharacterized protein YggE
MKKILAITTLLLFPLSASAQQQQEPPPRTITVSASGTVEREPEQGVVLLAVESESTNAKTAAEANAAKMAQLIAALRRTGIADRHIRTLSYELRPEYAQQVRDTREPPRIAGYRAINMVQVTVDTVTRMGGIIDVAIASGANRVDNIHFRLRDHQAAHIEAVAIAMRNARREAEAVAQAAGERLGPALNINTGGYMPPPPPMPAMYRRDMVMEQAMAPTPVEGGTLSVTANVTVVFKLLDP